MAIRGNLSEASLPDVLQLLAMGNKSGCLTLHVDEASGCIYFENGRISYAWISDRDLDSDDAVFAMFTWTHGAFSFEPGENPPGHVTRISVDAQELLLEGARRVDEWSLIEKKIPSFDLVFALDRQQMLGNTIAFSRDQQMLLPLIDGNRDVRELMRESGLGEFAVGKALYGLMSGAFVVAVSMRDTPPVVPDSVIAEHRNLGIAFYKARMYSDAAREFKRILELRSTDPSASFYLGLIALRDTRWDDAVQAFQRAAVSAPRMGSIFVNLGLAYERMGQFEKARLALEQVANRGTRPEPLAHLGLASLAIQRGDFENAALALAAARTTWGGTAPPALWYQSAGLLATVRGDLEGAVGILTEGVSRYPSSPVLLNNLAVAQESLGDFEHARQTIERAVHTDSPMPQVYRNLGDILKHAGRPEEAQAAYTRAANAGGITRS
jgi:tetratricopeptide (TPR) repeat protein